MVFSSSTWMNAVTFWNLFTFDALFSLGKTKMLLDTNSLNEFGMELVKYDIWWRISLQEVPYEFIYHPWIWTFIFQAICTEFHLFNVLEHPNKYINRSQCEFFHEYVQFVMYVVMTNGWLEHMFYRNSAIFKSSKLFRCIVQLRDCSLNAYLSRLKFLIIVPSFTHISISMCCFTGIQHKIRMAVGEPRK